jgi:hypothetical protein
MSTVKVLSGQVELLLLIRYLSIREEIQSLRSGDCDSKLMVGRETYIGDAGLCVTLTETAEDFWLGAGELMPGVKRFGQQ